MGHIINAKGMRLGWVSTWCDQWFAELQFYPEYLHSIYRIRFFLVYFFNMHALEQRGFFFSHFDILKVYKNFHIYIFYYDGQGESLYTDMLFNFFVAVNRDINNKDPETKVWAGHFEPLKIFIIFRLLFNFNLLDWKRKSRIVFYKAFVKYKSNTVKLLLLRHLSFSRRGNKVQITHLIFILLYFFNRKLRKRTKLYSRCHLEASLKRFFFILASLEWMYNFFLFIVRVLSFILSILSPQFNFKLHFFAISNNCVNAKFLSRFIARKFAQDYGFYELINPIRRELRTVCKETKGTYTGIFYSSLRSNIDLGRARTLRGNFFKTFLTYLFINYNKYSFNFFNKNKTYFSLNMLSIFIWINKFYDELDTKIYFSSKYFIRRSAFSYFFSGHYKKHIKSFNKFFSPDLNRYLLVLPKFNFTGFFNYIYEDYIVNSNFLFLPKLKLERNMTLFHYTQYHFQRYMQYKYWVYNDGLYMLGANYNPLKRRIYKRKKGGLLGFKMQCSGRFTRRQRASSIWFSYGTTPLNTLNARIDYSFFSIPIANSKITIKVWLHVNTCYPGWYFKLI